jgi:hypothetical protein
MGMGQEELTEPGMVAAGISEYFIIIDAIKKAVRGDGADPTLDDDISIYKIVTLLTEINRQPLANPLYSKMTKLILDKKIEINVNLIDQQSRKSTPFKIVIGEHRVIRETDE